MGPRSEFSQAKRIIPVLIVHDVLLGAPGFAKFAVSAFDHALGAHKIATSGDRLKGHLRVAAPIVLTVEDLEFLEVSTEHFSLLEVIGDYSDECVERMTSFNQFLAGSPKYSRQIYANRHLASSAMDALHFAMGRLFSESTVVG